MIRFQANKTSANVLAFRLYKPLGTEDIVKLSEYFREKLKICEKINLYIEIDDSINDSFEDIIKHFKLDLTRFLASKKNLQKVAIVTNEVWLRDTINTKKKHFTIDLKCYSFDKKHEALDWVISVTDEVNIMSEGI